jgi:hypothetical protein
LLAKPVRAICLYHIVTAPQPAFGRSVLSAGDAAEIATRWDFPRDDGRNPVRGAAIGVLRGPPALSPAAR